MAGEILPRPQACKGFWVCTGAPHRTARSAGYLFLVAAVDVPLPVRKVLLTWPVRTVCAGVDPAPPAAHGERTLATGCEYMIRAAALAGKGLEGQVYAEFLPVKALGLPAEGIVVCLRGEVCQAGCAIVPAEAGQGGRPVAWIGAHEGSPLVDCFSASRDIVRLPSRLTLPDPAAGARPGGACTRAPPAAA